MILAPNLSAIINSKKIKSVKCISNSITAYEMFEMEVDIKEVQGNGFDFSELSVDFEYTDKCENKLTHPAFLYKEYLPNNMNRFTVCDSSAPVWRIRITPQNEGEYHAAVIVRENGIITDQAEFIFYASKCKDSRGFIKVEPTLHKAFMFQNGEIFTPIGQNVCWCDKVDWKNRTSSETIVMYDRIFSRMNKFRANWTRLWLSASWDLSFFKKNDRTDDFSAALDRAARLDAIFKLYEKYDLYSVMVFYFHGMFNDGGANTDWENNAFNVNNPNGYLEKPGDFFVNPRCIKETKQYIRYMIARYGFSRNIFSWELFNEVNFTDGDPDDIKSWHREMSEFIRKTDSHPHMVTTSSSVNRYPLIFDEMFDYINMHRYGDPGNPKMIAHEAYLAFYDFNRPIMLEESGFDAYHVSVNPIMRHQQQWVGIMGNTPAGAMEWFWEEWDSLDSDNNDPYFSYRDFAPAAEFAKRIPRADKKQRFVSCERLALNDEHADVLGYNGEDYVFLWIYDRKYTVNNPVPVTISGVTMELMINSGEYIAEWYDTYKGEVFLTEQLTVKGDFVKIKTPEWSRDIALAITKNEK